MEESDAGPEGDEGIRHTFRYEGETYPAEILCDLLHTEGAETLAVYDNDFYAGMPVLTRNSFGSGCAYYVAARSSQTFYRKLLQKITGELHIQPPAKQERPEADDGGFVQMTLRENQNGSFLFLLNHGDAAECVTLEQGGRNLLDGSEYRAGETVALDPKGAAILCLS